MLLPAAAEKDQRQVKTAVEKAQAFLKAHPGSKHKAEAGGAARRGAGPARHP